ncbi:hypothetical protein HDU83_009346 [Entophlyctis luteolus]|nr:hypothetical protein HDU83_009346 [Entophlyctis luteolus]KAJ3388969.1 hypothetical protein HDU84_009293 [Entophlyctis sp. JEL0112]
MPLDSPSLDHDASIAQSGISYVDSDESKKGERVALPNRAASPLERQWKSLAHLPTDTKAREVLIPELPHARLEALKNSGALTLRPASASSTEAIAAALFGDPGTPMKTAGNCALGAPTVFLPSRQNRVSFEVNRVQQKILIFVKSTRKKAVEIDLSRWHSENVVTLQDLRDGYHTTEILEILRTPKTPTVYSVAAHTVMYSNLVPVGNISVDSDFKLSLHNDAIGVKVLSKPLFTITGEIQKGRFVIVARSKSSRQQKDVGFSSGWIAKKKIVKFLKESTFENNLEIDEGIWNDRADSLEGTLKPDQKLSQLLLAGICMAYAFKEEGS